MKILISLTGKYLVGSISKSISIPANRPLKDDVGYNKSTKFVSNVAKMTPLPEGVIHCTNSAKKNSCSKLFCNSVKVTTEENTFSNVNFLLYNNGKIGAILCDSALEFRVVIFKIIFPFGHSQTPGQVTYKKKYNNFII